MFEAYKIGIRVSVIDNVSARIHGMARSFLKAEGDLGKLQKRLSSIQNMAFKGGALFGVGAAGLDIMSKALKPAMEYESALNRLKLAGWSQVDIANAVGDAWKNTHDVMTTTVNKNLSSLLDLKNILGNLEEARVALPIVSKMQVVLASSSEGHVSEKANDLAYSATKALDIIGAARNPKDFENQANWMTKVIDATQGRVTPEAFKSAFQYARQAKFQLSDNFKYQILPTLIQENASGSGSGGGSRGVGPMMAAFYRWAVQGYINKKSLPELESLGLVSRHSSLKTTTSGTTVGAMKGADVASQSPFEWAWDVLIPALRKKYGSNMSEKEMLTHINQLMRGNQLAASLITEFAFKRSNFLRDAANIRAAKGINAGYDQAMKGDPKTSMAALSASWENLKTAASNAAVPGLIPVLNGTANFLNSMAGWEKKHPTLMKDLTLGFLGLFGAMALGGSMMMLTAGFRALGLGMAFKAAGGVGGILKMSKAIGGFGKSMLLSEAGGIKGILGATTALGKFGRSIAVVSSLAAAWEIGKWLGTMASAMGNNETQRVMGDKNATIGNVAYDRIHPFNEKTGKREFSFGGLLSTIWDPVPTASQAAVIKSNNLMAANYHRIWQNGHWLTPQQAMQLPGAWRAQDALAVPTAPIAPSPLSAAPIIPNSAGPWASPYAASLSDVPNGQAAPIVPIPPTPKAQALAPSEQPPQQPQIIQLHHQTVLDGKVLANTVTHYQVNAATGPQTGMSSFDSSMFPAPIGVSGSW